MTPEEQKAARERLNKATRRPWIAEGIGSEGYVIRANVKGSAKDIYDAVGFYGRIGDVCGGRDWQEIRANAELMARAPEDLEKTLDYINELESMPLVKMAVEQQREIERLRKALETIAYVPGWKPPVNSSEIARQALEDELHATL